MNFINNIFGSFLVFTMSSFYEVSGGPVGGFNNLSPEGDNSQNLEHSIKSWAEWFGDKFDNNPHNFALASIGIFIVLCLIIFFILKGCFRDKWRTVLFGWI